MALLLPCSEAATRSDEAFGRRLLFRRSELLGRPTLSFPLYQAFDVELHTLCTFSDGCLGAWFSAFSFFVHWLESSGSGLTHISSRGAGERRHTSVVGPRCARRLTASTTTTSTSTLPSQFCLSFCISFFVRVERIHSDSWLSSSLAAKLLRGVTRPSADVYSSGGASC